MENKLVMGKLLCIAFLFVCLSLNAQTLTKQDKQALRLYSKLEWYDFSTYRFKGQGKRAV
jgi:hypothetical protein